MLNNATKSTHTPPQATPINRQQAPQTADYVYAGGYMNFIAHFRWLPALSVALCI